MKKTISLFLIIVIALFLLSACNNNNEKDNSFEVVTYDIPSDLPDYALKLEWFRGDGTNAEFNAGRPTMILFNGVCKYNVRESFQLPTDIYSYDPTSITNGVLGYKASGMNTNLAYYWWRMGFNVGIYHYENFADDSTESLNAKVYDKNSMNYINSDGQFVHGDDVDFSLTEAFVMEWLKLMQDNPIEGTTGSRVMEVRFIGNSSGANLALSAAEYLYDIYEKGHISGAFVPTRVSILNPDFNNKEINKPVAHKENTNVYSVLSYNNTLMTKLSNVGMVFDMVESDDECFLSYQNPYSGLTSHEEVIDGETKTIYTLTDDGDCLLYKNIVSKTAYLSFNEEYSNLYTLEYKALDRAVRDWYLYTINGSDDVNALTTSTVYGYNETRPMVDNRTGGGSSSFPRYSVSAWTPTSFIRVLRGVKFEMSQGTWSNSIEPAGYVYSPYILKKIEAESYQVSDMTGVKIAGYVYCRKDESDFINYGYDTRLVGVSVRVIVEIDSSSEITLNTTTDQGGFYSIDIESKYYGKTCKVEVLLPNRNFAHSTKLADPIEYHKMSVSWLEQTSNTITVSAYDVGRSQVYLRNCGLTAL